MALHLLPLWPHHLGSNVSHFSRKSSPPTPQLSPHFCLRNVESRQYGYTKCLASHEKRDADGNEPVPTPATLVTAYVHTLRPFLPQENGSSAMFVMLNRGNGER